MLDVGKEYSERKICNKDPGEIRDFPSMGTPVKYFCIIFKIRMRVKLGVTSP